MIWIPLEGLGAEEEKSGRFSRYTRIKTNLFQTSLLFSSSFGVIVSSGIISGERSPDKGEVGFSIDSPDRGVSMIFSCPDQMDSRGISSLSGI